MNRNCMKSSLFMVLLVMALVAISASAKAVTCPQAVTLLQPCKDYLLGRADNVTEACCREANTLNELAFVDRHSLKTVCYCLKKFVAELHVIAAKAEALPGICHIQTIPISPYFNCDKI